MRKRRRILECAKLKSIYREVMFPPQTRAGRTAEIALVRTQNTKRGRVRFALLKVTTSGLCALRLCLLCRGSLGKFAH